MRGFLRARSGVKLEAIESDIEQMITVAAKSLDVYENFSYKGHVIDIRRPWPRMSVKEVLSNSQFTLSDVSLASLQSAAQAWNLDVSTAAFNDASFLFSVLISHVQRSLGFDKPVFIHDWPSFQTSSAPLRPGYDLTERSELIIGGIELADGFPFLTDHEAQRRAFNAQMALRQEMEMPLVSLDELYIKALQDGLPAGAGMALGFDRLVMLLTDR